MAISKMNQVLMYLYTNEWYRKLFFANPSKFLEKIEGLAKEERKALELINQDQVVHFSRSLLVKKRSKMLERFEPLTTHFSSEMRKFFHDFYMINSLVPQEPKLDYIVRFGFFLSSAIPQAGLPESACELADFITQKMQARKNNVPQLTLHSLECKKENRPILPDYVIINNYSFDMEELIKSFTPENAPNKEKCAYIMYSIDNKLHISLTSQALFEFLTMCTGAYTLGDIFKKFETKYKKDEIKKLETEILPAMLKENQIYFK